MCLARMRAHECLMKPTDHGLQEVASIIGMPANTRVTGVHEMSRFCQVTPLVSDGTRFQTQAWF